MRRPNVTRMRKVNMATIYESFPPRYVVGLPVDGEIPDFTPGAMWTLPDRGIVASPAAEAFLGRNRGLIADFDAFRGDA